MNKKIEERLNLTATARVIYVLKYYASLKAKSN